MINPFIEQGIELLRSKWSQSNVESSKYGGYLIIIPSILLPKSYRQTICTVLFVAPPGFPASCPDHFFTDIRINLIDGSYPMNTVVEGNFPNNIWPAWGKSMWWSWHLQHWNPNHDSLYSYMRVIEQRLKLGY